MSWPTRRPRKESSTQAQFITGVEDKIKIPKFIPLSSRYKQKEAKREQEETLKSFKIKKSEEIEKVEDFEKVCFTP